ncbi:MAG: outer membrane beta-barrel protein [Legionellales bacterium]
MKKLWPLGIILFFAQPVWAMEDDEYSWSYYVGVSGGVNNNTSEIAQALNFNLEDNFTAIPTTNFDADNMSAIGQIQLGTGLRNENFYWGAELSGQFFDGDFDTVSSEYIQSTFPSGHQHIEGNSQLSMNDFELALDFKPGVYLFEQTLLYARIGVAINELTLEQNSFANLESGDPNNVHIQTNSSTSKNVYPFRLGLGIERQFSEDFSILIDYVYTQYENISTSAHGEQVPLATLDAYSEATDITRQTVMLGFNYYL